MKKHLKSKEFPETGRAILLCPVRLQQMKDAEIMNFKKKAIITAVLLFVIVLMAAGCSNVTNAYDINDSEGYSFSVKFDSNGGYFQEGVYTIVDSYDLDQIPADSDGMKKIPLLDPADKSRGENNFFTVKSGVKDHFLVGWYTERTQVGVDSEGNPQYTYSGRYDFEKDYLTADPDKTYKSSEPQVTLYAAWLPIFNIEIYDRTSGELLSSIPYNPMESKEINLPYWDDSTGLINMNGFPKREGYTFDNVYLSADSTEPISGTTIDHCAVINYENATVENTTLKLYTDWLEGDWYHIYTADQFANNINLNGHYVIYNDLDFADAIWPSTYMYNKFNGTIQGNGYTIKNVNIKQNDANKNLAGLFGSISETAKISDVTFENVEFTISKGPRVQDTAYGLFAGAVTDGATLENVKLTQSKLLISSDFMSLTDSYYIGLVCGLGTADLETDGISFEVTGNNPDAIKLIEENGLITVASATESDDVIADEPADASGDASAEEMPNESVEEPTTEETTVDPTEETTEQ